MALSLAVVAMLVGVAWVFKDAERAAWVYAPLVFVGVICVISVGFFGRRLEQRLGDDATVLRINHAGGIAAGPAHWGGSVGGVFMSVGWHTTVGRVGV